MNKNWFVLLASALFCIACNQDHDLTDELSDQVSDVSLVDPYIYNDRGLTDVPETLPPNCQFPQFQLHPNGNPFLGKEGAPIDGWDPYVVYNEVTQTYQMYYTLFHNQILGIAYLESTDGINWCLPPDMNSPHVLQPTPGTWNRKGLETVSVLIHEGTYYMYFMGKPGLPPNGEPGQAKVIGLATSSNGRDWQKLENPVITPTQTWWEGPTLDTIVENEVTHIFWLGGVQEPSVIWSADKNIFEMYYGGVTKKYFPVSEGGEIVYKKKKWRPTGYAWSEDGINWNKHPNNPIFTPILPSGGSTNEGYAADHVGVVRANNGDYHLFYFAQFGIHHAYSQNGIDFNRNPNNPVVPPMAPHGQPVTYFGGPAPLLNNDQIRLYLMRSKYEAYEWGEHGMMLGMAVSSGCIE